MPAAPLKTSGWAGVRQAGSLRFLREVEVAGVGAGAWSGVLPSLSGWAFRRCWVLGAGRCRWSRRPWSARSTSEDVRVGRLRASESPSEGGELGFHWSVRQPEQQRGFFVRTVAGPSRVGGRRNSAAPGCTGRAAVGSSAKSAVGRWGGSGVSLRGAVTHRRCEVVSSWSLLLDSGGMFGLPPNKSLKLTAPVASLRARPLSSGRWAATTTQSGSAIQARSVASFAVDWRQSLVRQRVGTSPRNPLRWR
jgi:hypothetical protein